MKEKISNMIQNFKNLDKKRKALIIIIFILLLVLIGLLVYYFVYDKEPKEVIKDPVKIEVKDNFAYLDGSLIFYDKDKKEIGSYKCENKSEETCYVAYLNNEDKFTVEKNVNEDKESLDIRSDLYLEQYAFVFDNSDGEEDLVLYDFINKEKKGTYKVIKEDGKDNIILKNSSDKYGVISLTDKDIETLINFEYEFIGKIIENKKDTDDKLVVCKNGLYYLINNEEKKLTKGIDKYIVNYNDDYVLTIDDNGKYFVYDYLGNLKIENYNYIELIDDYVIVVDDNNKLMILDYENNKYLGEGIQLKNKNYIKTNIFDDKLNNTDTLYAYTQTKTGDNLSIYVKNNDNDVEYVIDLNEGKYSKDLDYSYFDGKLYFYTDETKQELLGSYKCKNPNKVSENTINCSTNIKTTSKNSVMYDKYVLILDNGTDTNIKYYLYDLKENKLKGNFVEFFIDGATDTEIGTAPVNFFAVSKSEKTGLVKLSKDGIDNFIKLENDDVRRFEDYYLLENSSKYILRDLNGIGILSTPFSYIEIKDNYFVVINEDSLLLYDFTGKQLIKEPVKINTKLYQFESYNISTIYTIEEKTSYYIIDNMTEKHYFNKTDGSVLAEADALLLGE